MLAVILFLLSKVLSAQIDKSEIPSWEVGPFVRDVFKGQLNVVFIFGQ